MGLFSNRRPPTIVPTDTIAPAPYFDDQLPTKTVVLHLTYRFGDLLDPEKLRLSLVRLMELPGWNKIGGRIRQNASGRLEYHIPAKYDVNRPGFVWSHVDTGSSIDSHYIGRHLPKAGPDPIIFGNTEKFRLLVTREHTPTRLEEYLYTDEPPLSVCVVNFTDATLLTLSWPHALFDGMGCSILLEAWIAVLDGREEDVLPYIRYDMDPFETLNGKTPPEKYLFYDTLLTGLNFLLFVIYMVLEFVLHPIQSNRTVFFPASLIQSLRDRAIQDLAVSGSTNLDPKPFVSEGDVILAWWAKVTVTVLRFRSSRIVNLINVMDFRGMIDDVLPPNQAFISNAFGTIHTITTVRELLEEPLGTTAMKIRRSLEQQKTREQIEAYVSLHKLTTKKNSHPPFFGPASQQMIALSNWYRARYFKTDWSSAVVRPRMPSESRVEKMGRPSYIYADGFQNGYSPRNCGALIGKDANGNFWMTWLAREKAWPRYEDEMRRWQKMVM